MSALIIKSEAHVSAIETGMLRAPTSQSPCHCYHGNIPLELWIVEIVGRHLSTAPDAIASLRQTCHVFAERVPLRTMCLAAVRQDGTILRFVPTSLQDYSMCLAAVTQKSVAIFDVPTALQDHAMWLITITEFGMAIGWVPWHLRDRAMYIAAVTQNRRSLELVPEHLRTTIANLVAKPP